MSIDSLKLLRKLEPPIRPAGRYDAPGLPFERQDFQTLLASVSASGRSDQPVTITAELDEPVTSEQQERLAVAADVATRHGAGTALLLMDGRGLVLDVAERDITSELRRTEAVDLDVAVYVAGEDEMATVPPGPGTGLIPDSIAAARRQLNTPTDHTMKITQPDERAGLTD